MELLLEAIKYSEDQWSLHGNLGVIGLEVLKVSLA